MISKGFYVDYVYINLLILIVTVVIVSICILFIIASVNIRNIDILFGRVQALQITKQDDVGEYLTEEEWDNLCSEYHLELVKPYGNITRNTAISLLKQLNKSNDRTPF